MAVPASSVTTGGLATALLWDPLQEWLPGKTMPSAVFDVPNRIEDRESHLLGLFVPSVPELVAENALIAFAPVALAANAKLAIECRLFAAGSADPALAVKRWHEAYGARPPPSPRSDLDELRLSLDGYLGELWSPSGMGWAHAVPSTSFQPFPCMIANVLHALALDPTNPKAGALSAQAQAALAQALVDFGPGGLITNAGCHLLDWELPFLVGRLDEGIGHLLGWLAGVRPSQAADGSWAFQGDPSLGAPGSVELGTCASNALVLLKGARITGDSAAGDAGIKALERMRAFDVPRAAQTWEVPVHTPDILAAALACHANLEGYRVSGDPGWLEESIRRADEGLPFLYTWGAPGIEVMPFASTPVFGATHYVGSWIGRPVQWCGLVHAAALIDLAIELEGLGDPRAGPFREVALGVTRSAFHQQYTSGSRRGLLPDSWILATDSASPADINPSSMLHMLWMLRGEDLEVETASIPAGGRFIRISAVPGPRSVRREPDGVIHFDLTMRSGLASYFVVTLPAEPLSLVLDGAAVPRLSDADSAPPASAAWAWRAGTGVIAKAPAGSARTARITIRETPRRFLRGDANADGSVDVSDAVFALLHLFGGGREPACIDALDSGDNGIAGIDDVVGLLGYLFRTAPPPAPPHPTCGVDPTPDSLSCERSTARC